jgi:hypothetical protein
MIRDLTWWVDGFSPGQDRGIQANGQETKKARIDDGSNVLKRKGAEAPSRAGGGRHEGNLSQERE